MKHFKLTTEFIENIFGTKLFRIELTIDCKWGKAGDKGGFLETEENLSGNAWVSGNARVYGDAHKKSPIQIQGSRHFVNYCGNGEIKIGCKIGTFDWWKENYVSIGKENNHTDAEIKEYGMYIDVITACEKAIKEVPND